ncbi:hypothetical protein J2T16_005797 [Paenibacillus intestini]|nr:hypothetical protein [Paenibacillus intestini]
MKSGGFFGFPLLLTKLKAEREKIDLFFYTETERTEKTWKSEALAFITGFYPLGKGTKKSGDNSD